MNNSFETKLGSNEIDLIIKRCTSRFIFLLGFDHSKIWVNLYCTDYFCIIIFMPNCHKSFSETDRRRRYIIADKKEKG